MVGKFLLQMKAHFERKSTEADFPAGSTLSFKFPLEISTQLDEKVHRKWWKLLANDWILRSKLTAFSLLNQRKWNSDLEVRAIFEYRN